MGVFWVQVHIKDREHHPTYILYTRVNKRIHLFPKHHQNHHHLFKLKYLLVKQENNMRLIMKATLTTPQKPRCLFGSTCNITEESSRRGRWLLYCCYSLAMKPLGEKLISWNRQYTEGRLSGVGSPSWFGVHRGLPKECELWCHDKRWFLSWWEQLM